MSKLASSRSARTAPAGRAHVAKVADDGADTLSVYRRKRDFDATPEPAGTTRKASRRATAPVFVIQKHWASRLHYDLRLEIDGVMKSWAVPKGPSLDPRDKRMAVQVEDHPMDYNRFEGRIPAGHYGAGQVIVWDQGHWQPDGDPAQGWREGKLKFMLSGHKLQGAWTLVRMSGRGAEKQPPWLLIKERDDAARARDDYSVVDAEPDSVAHQGPADEGRGKRSAAPSKAKPRTKAPRGQRVALPAELAPQLATLVERAPADPKDWLFELKFDGYRMLARLDKGRVKLLTRNGHDWSDKLPALTAALKTLPLRSGWLDGEIVALGASGAPDFQALQNAFDGRRTAQVVFYLFDLPYADGEDLRALPLTERRERLRGVLSQVKTALLRFSEAFDAPPADLVTSACRIGFEGVIGKRRDSTYVSRRSADWIKLKCSHRQEFVMGSP